MKSVALVLIFLSVFYCKAASTSCGPPPIFCYFTNWAWYRPGVGKFMPSNIDTTLCTHVVYAFAKLDPVNLIIVPSDPWADISNNFYAQITSLKTKGIVVLLSLGGWIDSAGNKYSRLVSSVTARQNFITQSKQFLLQYGFQGLDIDWEFPVCWQADCSAGPASDKQNFGDLLIGLKAAYSASGLLLTAAVSSSPWIADHAYNVPLLSQNLNFIGVMNYDYHGAWEGVTGANSPHSGSPSTLETLNYYVQKGADPCKLIVGLPLYAKTFKLANTANTYFGAPVIGAGSPGPYTGESGFLAYYELCSAVRSQSCWTVLHMYTNSSCAFDRYGQWASYCSPEDILTRTQLILSYPYRGAMIWAVDLDDFNNICGCGKYPLLRTLNIGLGRRTGPPASCP